MDSKGGVKNHHPSRKAFGVALTCHLFLGGSWVHIKEWKKSHTSHLVQPGANFISNSHAKRLPQQSQQGHLTMVCRLSLSLSLSLSPVRSTVNIVAPAFRAGCGAVGLMPAAPTTSFNNKKHYNIIYTFVCGPWELD